MPFDEDPADNRSEIGMGMCIDEIKNLQIENKKLKTLLKASKCPNGCQDGGCSL